MTVQTLPIIRDRILYADHEHKLAVFELPPVEDSGKKWSEHNGFKYNKDHVGVWFDSFFAGMVVSDQLIESGTFNGGKLIGVYGKYDIARFDEDIFQIQIES